MEAATLLRAGEPEGAVSLCLNLLKHFPNDVNILCLAAQSLIALRRFDESRMHIEKTLELQPGFVGGHETLGDLLLVEGDPMAAISAYTRAIAIAPDRGSPLALKVARAENMALESRQREGQHPVDQFADAIAQAEQFKEAGEPAKAEQAYRDILRRNPDHAEAMRLLAEVATVHNKYEDAELLLLRAVLKAPRYGRAWLDLSKTQQELGKYADSIESAQKLVALAPEISESYLPLANALSQANRNDEAIENYRKVLELAPQHRGGFSGLANQLKTIGKQEEAIAVHRQNLVANPDNAEAYWNLANLKTFRFESRDVIAMEGLLSRNTLDELGTAQLCSALGLENEARKKYSKAFGYFRRCNDIKRQMERYDPVGHEIQIQKIMEVFSADFQRIHSGNGCEDASPIFIVGLPRSGSTLLEQILASHSQVEGTHELSDLPHMMQAYNRTTHSGLQFPETLRETEASIWEGLGRGYIDRTAKYRSGVPYFIDKNPNNFIYAGLLGLILPNAKIINAKRHPLDSCLGSYKQLFASGQPFSYDLMDIGEYYLNYQTLMDHWHSVMPGRVLDVNYANVVSDLESQVRRLLDYCELPFEDACLRFHETERAVKTASSEQVRQPIYSSSVNLWRRYEQDLGELVDILCPLLIDLPLADRPSSLA
ncbi:MAG: tetratricopeptide (TPR) repeat protein [Halioglobus sp.]|jgi:tetratricopeptide (TPR) repeat protein